MTALVKQITMLCLLMAIGEQLLKDKSSLACLRMIVAGRITASVLAYTQLLLNRCVP